MSCPECGADNDPEARFCRRCGTPLAEPVGRTRDDDDTDPDDDTTDPDAVATSAILTRPPQDPLRTCPNCGANNSPRRLLCGRCGADLESGHVVEARPRPATVTAAGADDDDRSSSLLNRTAVAIVTAGLLIGAGLGAMVALGIGPFAEDDGPPPAGFDDSAYPGPPGSLDDLTLSIGASSTHEPVGDATFGPQLMIDGDPATAWNSSGETRPGGVGEQVRIEFPEPVWLTRIVVDNGDGRDDARFLGNARVKRALVVLDAGVSFTILLADDPAPQAVSLDVPELTTGLRIEVLETYPGDTYEDLAISEIAFGGYLATEEDAAVAARRARFPRVVPSP